MHGGNVGTNTHRLNSELYEHNELSKKKIYFFVNSLSSSTRLIVARQKSESSEANELRKKLFFRHQKIDERRIRKRYCKRYRLDFDSNMSADALNLQLCSDSEQYGTLCSSIARITATGEASETSELTEKTFSTCRKFVFSSVRSSR